MTTLAAGVHLQRGVRRGAVVPAIVYFIDNARIASPVVLADDSLGIESTMWELNTTAYDAERYGIGDFVH